MTFDIVMPELNKKPKNTKDAVITLLTHEWPLTLREIFFRIKNSATPSPAKETII